MTPTQLRSSACAVVAMIACAPHFLTAQTPPEAYRTRTSQCRHEQPSGQNIATPRTDTGIKTSGYTAERIVTLSADAKALNGGEIIVCTEYGNVEITDSDNSDVRLQVRIEGFGEGSEDPARAAARVIEETNLHTYITAHEGRITVRVWHSTLGFTDPGAQPAWLSVRLQVPARGAYNVRTEAFHGDVAVRRLTLASATMRGAVGYKLKGIPGFLGITELDNVLLAGDVDIDNLIGLPGIRPPAAPQLTRLAAPIIVKARALSNSRVTAVTGGNIDIAIQPAPDLGVRGIAESNDGNIRVGVDGGIAVAAAVKSAFQKQQSSQTSDYDAKRVRVEVRASSGPGNVNISSVPAAPLKR